MPRGAHGLQSTLVTYMVQYPEHEVLYIGVNRRIGKEAWPEADGYDADLVAFPGAVVPDGAGYERSAAVPLTCVHCRPTSRTQLSRKNRSAPQPVCAHFWIQIGHVNFH